MSNKSPKPPRKVEPHRNKYSKNPLGAKEKSSLEVMLKELEEIEGFKSTEDYQTIYQMDKDPKNQYKFIKKVYYKYLNQ